MSRFLADVLQAGTGSKKGITVDYPHDPRKATWHEIGLRARCGARILVDAGVRPGATVPILTSQPIEVATAAQSAWLCGAAVTMLQQPTARMSRPAWIGSTTQILAMLNAHTIVVGESFRWAVDALQQQGFMTVFADAFEPQPHFTPVDIPEGAAALRQLTSGSTGTPKAVEISHRNLWAATNVCHTSFGLDTSSDVLVNWLPLAHDLAMIMYMSWPMQTGAELIAITADQFIRNPAVWPQMITEFSGTITAGPHFSYVILSRVLDRSADGAFDLSSLRLAINGSEPINSTDLARLAESGRRFGLRPEAMTPGYGLAEATLIVSVSAADDVPTSDRILLDDLTHHHRAVPVDARNDGGSVVELAELGHAVHGIDIRIRSARGACGPRQVGAIEIRGDSVAEQYVTVGGALPLADADGWFDTGDVGYLNEDGALFVCGRKKDVIIVGGRNLYPTDIEHAAQLVDGVRNGNVAAVALAASTASEGFAVLAESVYHDKPDVVARIRRDIVHMVTGRVGHGPALVAVIPPGTLPKTPSGKLRRHAAAALAVTD
ncbi:long-chain-fatty-acid--CoA ligase [Mycobacterium sp. MUNTM1]